MARFGRRRGRAGGGEASAQGEQPTGATPTGGGEQPTSTPAGPGAPAQPTQPPSKPTTGSQPVVQEPTIHERLEGQRAWLAQLDRRVGVRTYAGAAALVIALAAAAVALVLVLQLDEEAAKTGDVDRLREEIVAVEDSATRAAQEDVQSLTERVTELESDISDATSNQDSTEQQLSVLEDDIQDLRDQISDLGSDGGGGGGNNP